MQLKIWNTAWETIWKSLLVLSWMGAPQAAPLVNIEMVSIPGGSFSMGDRQLSRDERPVHIVHIPAFKMGKYEVTQAQWKKIMGNNPSRFKGDQRPVEFINWHQVHVFISRLNAQTGKQYRLPSEAEWEYAARAGHSAVFSWGEAAGKAGQYAWFDGNSGHKTHPVGRKLANAYGLYDMQGNVWEWLEDCYHQTYQDAQSNAAPLKTGECIARSLRGGSWRYDAYFMRSALRMWDHAGGRSHNTGFRLALPFTHKSRHRTLAHGSDQGAVRR